MRNQILPRMAATLGFVTTIATVASLAAQTDKPPPPIRAVKKPSPMAASTDIDASYRCRPDEDIACTVVRETAQGVLIVTFRPAGTMTERKTWAVVSGVPAGAAATAGAVYVVPSLPQNLVAVPAQEPPAVTASLPNGAPILE